MGRECGWVYVKLGVISDVCRFEGWRIIRMCSNVSLGYSGCVSGLIYYLLKYLELVLCLWCFYVLLMRLIFVLSLNCCFIIICDFNGNVFIVLVLFGFLIMEICGFLM